MGEGQGEGYVSRVIRAFLTSLIRILLLLLFTTSASQAEMIKSGTGFYVTPRHVVTNEHVISGCKQIFVRGAVQPTTATVLDVNKTLDLALLRTDEAAPRTAYLRSNPGLKIGDTVHVIGYPGKHAQTGEYLLKQAKVVDTDFFYNGISGIQITDSVNHGNSGGPLLDYAGNVIGVVVAKMYYRKVLPDGSMSPKAEEIRGVAIGLPVLKSFLQKSEVFLIETSSYDIFPDPHPDERAREYTVNVFCVVDEP